MFRVSGIGLSQALRAGLAPARGVRPLFGRHVLAVREISAQRFAGSFFGA